MVPSGFADWIVLLIGVATGLAIWVPTQASAPRYSYGADQDMGSAWFIPLTAIAVCVLSAVFARRWQFVVPGVVGIQLLLAPFTAPRGDNDGLWILIVPLIAVLGFGLLLVSFFVARVVIRLRKGSE
jgi:hypothetical protein